MPFPALDALEGRLQTKTAELAAIFAEAGPDIDLSKVKSVSGDSAAKVEYIRTLNAEIDDVTKQVEPLREVKAAAERAARHLDATGKPGPYAEPGDGTTTTGQKGEPDRRTFGELFTASAAYKGRSRGGVGPAAAMDVDLKTLMTTTAGWAPETTRTGRVVDFATRPIQVTDVVPSTTTGQAAVVYMEETTFTNSAAETAEGGAFPEAALALTEQSSPVRKIAVFLPVTDEQLEDEQLAQGYINNRLPFMLRQRLDGQILVGNGTAPNLRGFLNVLGIQTQAKGADPVPDAVYKAMTKIRVTGRALPGAVVMHPNDWQDIRTLRTADGIYIWGSPADTGPDRIWGLPVVQSDAITENTALVGDFATFTELAVRRGIDVQVSNSHSTFFVEGKQAIRADMRAALIAYRPSALCTVTGI